MVEIIPDVGPQKDWSVIEERLNLAIGLAPWMHVDVADDTLVPNKTFMEFEKFKPYASRIALEAHLMVAEPERYVHTLVDAGFKRLIAHVEAHDPRVFLDLCKHEEIEVGIAIDGPTEFEQIEPFLEEVDFVLVMTIEAGFSGQKFLPECVEKIKTLRAYLPDLPIEVDGGMTDVTARLVREAGATRIVSASYVFQDVGDIAGAIERLQNA